MKPNRRAFLQGVLLLGAASPSPCDSDYYEELDSGELLVASEASSQQAEPPQKPVARKSIPTVKIGQYNVSRLIIGANPFYGYSHFNRLFSRHMVEWATPERVCATLRKAEENGINTWQFSHNPRSIADLQKYRAEGGTIQWILLSSRQMENDLNLIPELARLGPIGIVHHGGAAERRWRQGELGKVREFLQRVRDSGVMVGLSVHNPELLEFVEERGWDIDFYMTSLYYLTRTPEEFHRLLGTKPLGEVYLPEDPPRMFRAIRATSKPCLCYKVLAAGRLTDRKEWIEQAFRTTFENIKPSDCIIVGMYPRYEDQVTENADLVRRILKELGSST